MARKNPAVDDYIRNAAGFAQPILRRLRKLVHEGCPDVIEQIKWGCPHFAHHGMLCHIAAFKQHCVLGFRRHQLLVREGLLTAEAHAQPWAISVASPRWATCRMMPCCCA